MSNYLFIVLLVLALTAILNKKMNRFLRRHRTRYGILDTVYLLVLFGVSCDVLERWLAWWLGGTCVPLAG